MSWRDVSGPDGFDARLLWIGAIGGEGPLRDRVNEKVGAWFLFLRPAGGPYWLCGGAIEGDPPESIALEEQKRKGTVKLCALLGLSWEEIEAKPAESADWQLECMRKLGPRMKAGLRNATPEDIAEWRAEMHTLEPGEDLRQEITGVDPRAGRN